MKKKLLLISLFVILGFGLHISQTLANEIDNSSLVHIPQSAQLKSYYIGRYSVTNAQYSAFLKANPSVNPPKYWKNRVFPTGKANHPVVFVSYDDAVKFCNWLGKNDSKFKYRLPTVQEWEYAALGSNNYAYPWGNENSSSNFNYNKNVASVYLKSNPTVKYINPKSSQFGKTYKLNQIISINPNGSIAGWINHKDYTGFVYTDLFNKLMDSGGYTTQVNQYPNGKSVFGVYDMSGNTWDWTSSDITASNGAERGQIVKAIKGGSWYANANSCKIKMQGEGRRPQSGYNTVGFRVIAEKKL